MELSYQVDRDHAGCCVRQAARGPMHLSEKLWRKIKWNGTITVNGSPVSSPSHRLEAGDRLVFHWEEKAAVIPVHLPLSVLYEDEDLLVVDKPAGMLIHPTWSAPGIPWSRPWEGISAGPASTAASIRCTGWTGIPPGS